MTKPIGTQFTPPPLAMPRTVVAGNGDPIDSAVALQEKYPLLLFYGPADGQVHPPVLSATSAEKNARILSFWNNGTALAARELSPIANIFTMTPDELAALPSQREAVRGLAQDVQRFNDGLSQANTSVDGVRSFEKTLGGSLTAPQYSALLKTYHDRGAYADVVRVFEGAEHSNQLVGTLPLPREFYVYALSQTGQAEQCISAGRAFGETRGVGKPLSQSSAAWYAEKGVSAHILNSMGEAFSQMRDPQVLAQELGHPADNPARNAHEIAARYFEAGFTSSFDYRAGMRCIENHLEVNTPESRQRARNLAPIVEWASRKSGKRDAQHLTAQLQLALLTDRHDDARELLPELLHQIQSQGEADSVVPALSTPNLDRHALPDVVRSLKSARYPLSEDAISNITSLFDTQCLSGGSRRTDIGPTVPDLKDKATAVVFDRFFHIDKLESSMVPGNAAQGGSVPDMPISRAGIEIGRKILSQLGLDEHASFDQADEAIDRYIQQRFNLEDAQGQRPLEDLHGASHADLDQFRNNLLALAKSDTPTDTRTNLMLELVLGQGDCRQVAYAGKQALMDIWRHDGQKQLLRQATSAALQGRAEERDGYLLQADRMSRELMMTASFTVRAPLDMVEKYNCRTDAQGRPQPSPDGRMRDVENHTNTWKVVLDDRGRVVRLEARDAFYQTLYPWKKHPVTDLQRLAETGDFDGGVMGIQNANGDSVPCEGHLSRYSGRRSVAPADDCGFMRLAGMPVLPPGDNVLLGDAVALRPLIDAIRNLKD